MGARPGTTPEIEVTGTDLEKPTGLRFSNTNIAAFWIEPPVSTNKPSKPAPMRFRVVVPGDAPEGIIEVRVLGTNGASTSRPFIISAKTELTQSPTNRARSSARELHPGEVINARAGANDADYYSLQFTAGQRMLILCTVSAIDSKLKPDMTLSDSRGRELAHVHGASLLDFTPTTNSTATLRIADDTYAGGEEYSYRVEIWDKPWLDFTMPMALAQGTTKYVTLVGRNLPGGTVSKRFSAQGKALEELSVEVTAPTQPAAHHPKPAAASLDFFEYQLAANGLRSNPILIGLSDLAVVEESENHHQVTNAQPVQIPCDISGTFSAPSQTDWFRFMAKKGTTLHVETFSNRLGWPTHPFLYVGRLKKGTLDIVEAIKETYSDNIANPSAELPLHTHDVALKYEISEDGDYVVHLRDLFNARKDHAPRAYRLRMAPEKPGFRLFAAPQMPPLPNPDARELQAWTAHLRRGATVPIKLYALREQGFTGLVQVQAKGLPEGITTLGGRIEAGANTGTLLLTASDSAQDWTGPIMLTGVATIASNKFERAALPARLLWKVDNSNELPVYPALGGELVISVTSQETAPLRLIPGKLEWTLTSTGKVQIPIRVAREGETPNKFTLKPLVTAGLPAPKALELEPKATNGVVELDFSKSLPAPGEYWLHFETQTQFRYPVPAEKPGSKEPKKAAKETLLTVLSQPIRIVIPPAKAETK